MIPHVARRIQRFLDPASGDTLSDRHRAEMLHARRLVRPRPGEGTVKRILPDSHADFVFAVAAEEFGIVLCLALVALFAFIVLRALTNAHAQRAIRSRALATAGLAILFGTQSAINMAVNLSLIPAKGMTLPFISYGGSSMISLAYGMGMLLALTRERPNSRSSCAAAKRSWCPAGTLPHGSDALVVRRGRRHRRPSVSGRGARVRRSRGAASWSILRPTRAPPRYGGDFPARATHIIPSATVRGRNPRC